MADSDSNALTEEKVGLDFSNVTATQRAIRDHPDDPVTDNAPAHVPSNDPDPRATPGPSRLETTEW